MASYQYPPGSIAAGPIPSKNEPLGIAPTGQPPPPTITSSTIPISDPGSRHDIPVNPINQSKPIQSCQFCRRRKIRCDKTLPCCSQCLKASATCIYPKRKSRTSHSAVSGLTAPQSREEQLLNRISKLEAAIQGLRVPGERVEIPEDEITDPLGKLTVGQPYLNDGFFGSNEFNALLEDSTDEADSEDEEFSLPIPSSRGADFVFGVSPIFEDLSVFHPPPAQILQYWQIYLDNCDCLLKLVHAPTFNLVVQNAVRNGFRETDKGDELLLFCFYFAAIMSLTEEEALHQFGQERSSLLERHELAIKHGLTRARFLQSQDLRVLQALVIFLTCMPSADPIVSAVAWNMLGLAFRIAQSMGIDRDGELFKLKPFDTEFRRRLWYQLLFLDLRAAEARGCLSTVLQYDTQPPTSINDSDLHPEMTEYLKPATGLTDMTVPLMRYEAARLGRRLQATNFRDTVLPPLAKRNLIERIQKDLDERHIKYCQGAGAFYEYCSKVVRMIISRTNLVVYQEKIRTASQPDRDWLFNICIQIMEFYQELSGDMTCRRWTWLLKIHIQWHAVAFVLKELCDRVPGSSPDIGRAWRVVDATCDEWRPPPDSAGTLVYESVKRLLSKARRRKERHSRESGDSSLSPSTSMDSSSGASASTTTNTSSSASAQQTQRSQGPVPYEFPVNASDPVFNTMAAGMDMSLGAAGRGGALLEDPQLLFYEFQTVPSLEEFTSLPEWFFPNMSAPPIQSFDMSLFNPDDTRNFSGG